GGSNAATAWATYFSNATTTVLGVERESAAGVVLDDDPVGLRRAFDRLRQRGIGVRGHVVGPVEVQLGPLGQAVRPQVRAVVALGRGHEVGETRVRSEERRVGKEGRDRRER